MPIADTYVPLKSSGNGSTQDFSFNFYIGSTANLRVYEEDDVTLVQTLKTLGSDYTATFNDDTPGGNVHFLVAPAAGKSIIRARSIPKTQETPLKTSSGFKAEVVQTIVDKLTALVQDVGEIASRAIKLPIGSSSSVVIPAPSAGKAIVGNQTSNGFVNSEVDLTTLEDKVDDVDAAVAAAEAAQSASESAQSSAEAAQAAAEAAAGSLTYASQAEAEAGTEAAKAMSPLRTKQAIDALQRAIASQAEAEAGTDNTKTMTPLQVKNEVQKAGAVAIPGGNISALVTGNWTIGTNQQYCNTVYQAATDMVVIVTSVGANSAGDYGASILSDASNPPTKTVAQLAKLGMTLTGRLYLSCAAVIKKGQYWKVATTQSGSGDYNTVNYAPIGA